jgi:hypothetical protein
MGHPGYLKHHLTPGGVEHHAVLYCLHSSRIIEQNPRIHEAKGVRQPHLDVAVPPLLQIDWSPQQALDTSEGFNPIGSALTSSEIECRDRAATVVAKAAQ